MTNTIIMMYLYNSVGICLKAQCSALSLEDLIFPQPVIKWELIP